jgi:hypothetical protein
MPAYLPGLAPEHIPFEPVGPEKYVYLQTLSYNLSVS